MQEPDRQALDRSQGKELTGISNREAERSALKLENAGQTLEKNFLSPTADTRNTIIATSLLTVVKLSAGLLGDSLGLIGDGGVDRPQLEEAASTGSSLQVDSAHAGDKKTEAQRA